MLNRVQSSEYRVLHRVLDRAYLVPHRSSRQPLTPNRARIPCAPGRDQRPCWSEDKIHGRPGRSALPETDGVQSTDCGVQRAATRTECGVLNRLLSRAYLVPHRSNRYPLPPNRSEYPAHQVGTSVPAGPRIRFTADRDGQPYLKMRSTRRRFSRTFGGTDEGATTYPLSLSSRLQRGRSSVRSVR